MKYPAPAPVVILRPVMGELKIAEVIEKPVFIRRSNDFEGEIVVRRFRLVAVQETGEEMFAGFASTRAQALDIKYSWMESHPEHIDVRIEQI